MMKSKKLIIGIGAAVIILVVLIVVLLLNNKGGGGKLGLFSGKNTPAPDFLNDKEKASLDLSSDAKVQSLRRDDNGEVMIYKIIYDDSDIVADPANMPPISPRVLPNQ
ncbi:MAG: hypothetical protein WC905_00100 [Patescibacteria group bacterium]|jgi:hypothetical protein